jgi:hypothetical protein
VTNVAVIAMSAKPYHKGHAKLVQTAATECGLVKLFVSISSRECISPEMTLIYWSHIQPTLPQNVELVLSKTSPVKLAYEFIGSNEENASEDNFFVYGDPLDVLTNFPDKSLKKYFPRLFEAGRVSRRSLDRSLTDNISGTLMRDWIKNGREDAFKANLPDGVDIDFVWRLFSGQRP